MRFTAIWSRLIASYVRSMRRSGSIVMGQRLIVMRDVYRRTGCWGLSTQSQWGTGQRLILSWLVGMWIWAKRLVGSVSGTRRRIVRGWLARVGI